MNSSIRELWRSRCKNSDPKELFVFPEADHFWAEENALAEKVGGFSKRILSHRSPTPWVRGAEAEGARP